jgi:hypothetical protein
LASAPGFIRSVPLGGDVVVFPYMSLSERRDSSVTLFGWFGALLVSSVPLFLVVSLCYGTVVAPGRDPSPADMMKRRWTSLSFGSSA